MNTDSNAKIDSCRERFPYTVKSAACAEQLNAKTEHDLNCLVLFSHELTSPRPEPLPYFYVSKTLRLISNLLAFLFCLILIKAYFLVALNDECI